jgi:transcriptional regulator with XRE-family HTH domain
VPSSAPEVAPEVDVGERLRVLRGFRRLTLRAVADRSGLSESFISQVERGDSVDYRSSTPHRVANTGETTAEVLWIVSPPSY